MTKPFFLILRCARLRASKDDLVISYGPSRHCEERSDEAIHWQPHYGLLRFARNDGSEPLIVKPRSRSSARRRRSPSIPSARGGIPPASPCGISAATSSSWRECRRHAWSP